MIRRCAMGLLVAVLSVLTVHQGMWEELHLGLLPGLSMPPAWSISPVPPWGVPLILDLCFWGGLYGIAYGLAAPRNWLIGGTCLGLVALLIGELVVTPIKGGSPRTWQDWVVGGVIDIPWGIGVGALFSGLERWTG